LSCNIVFYYNDVFEIQHGEINIFSDKFDGDIFQAVDGGPQLQLAKCIGQGLATTLGVVARRLEFSTLKGGKIRDDHLLAFLYNKEIKAGMGKDEAQKIISADSDKKYCENMQ